MPKVYSVYEAKAKLSELLRVVKSGNEVWVQERGKSIARVIPFDSRGTFQDNLRLWEEAGVLNKRRRKEIPSKGESRPGGLKRFLKDR